MLIGEIAKRSQLSRDTIRFYEKKGLIKVGRSNSPFNDYKEYSEGNLQRLTWIRRMKDFGFTLNEISGILDLLQKDMASCTKMNGMITEKIASIDQKIIELQHLKSSIISRTQDVQSACNNSFTSSNCKTLSEVSLTTSQV